MTAKVEKNTVGYGAGHFQSHCGPTFRDDHYWCRHFLPTQRWDGRCEKVIGDIEPTHWCELYQRLTNPE